MSVRALRPRSRERLWAVVIVTRDSAEKPMIMDAARAVCLSAGCGRWLWYVCGLWRVAGFLCLSAASCGLWAVGCGPSVSQAVPVCLCSRYDLRRVWSADVPQTVRGLCLCSCSRYGVRGLWLCVGGCGGLWRNGGAGVTPLTTFSTKNLANHTKR